MRKILLFLLFLTPSTLLAQGVRHVNIAQGSVTLAGSSGFSGAVARILSGASVTVCTGSTLPAAGSVCTGLASIFSDIALTQALANPTTADTIGNYSFYAAAGVPYVVSVSFVGFTTYSYIWSAPLQSSGTITNAMNLVGPGTVTGNYTHSGTETFNNTIISNSGVTLNGAGAVFNGTQATFNSGATFNGAGVISTAAATLSSMILPGGTSGSITHVAPAIAGSNTITDLAATGTEAVTITSAAVNLPAQATNISATTLYAVPASGAGFYRATCYIVLTQAATSSATLPGCQITWTDTDTSVSESLVPLQSLSTNVVGNLSPYNTAATTLAAPSVQMNVKASTNIQYNTFNYASSGVTPMQYAIHIRLEYLGP